MSELNTGLKSAVVSLLSDGRPRAASEIQEELRQCGKEFHADTVSKFVYSRYLAGELESVKLGDVRFYALRDEDLDAVRELLTAPDCLMEREFDRSKDRRDAILDLLSDGKTYTVEQLAMAYFSKVDVDRYAKDVQKSQILSSCYRLSKWGMVERVEIYRRRYGWRLTA